MPPMLARLTEPLRGHALASEANEAPPRASEANMPLLARLTFPTAC